MEGEEVPLIEDKRLLKPVKRWRQKRLCMAMVLLMTLAGMVCTIITLVILLQDETTVAIVIKHNNTLSQIRLQNVKKKNVLMIMSDDLRPELGLYQKTDDAFNSYIKTPNLDRLGKESMVFYNMYAQYPQCGPSRGSLLTGKRPDTTGVKQMSDKLRDKSPNVVTLPQYFKQQGYITYASGKIFHYGQEDNEYSWSEDNFQAKNRDWYNIQFNSSSWGIPSNKMLKQRLLPDKEVLDYAKDKLNEVSQHPEQPFFIAVGFQKPHVPYYCPKEFYDLYPLQSIPQPIEPQLIENFPYIAWTNWADASYHPDITNTSYGSRLSPQKLRELRRGYYACITFVDSMVKELLDSLNTLNLSGDTIVSFSSDHGYHLGEHSLWSKNSLLHLDAHIPWMLKIPGVTDSGMHSKQFVENVDIFPTLVEAAGLNLVPQCSDSATDLCHEGESAYKYIEDESLHGKQWVLTQFQRTDDRDGVSYTGYSIRDHQYHYIRWVLTDPTGTPDWENTPVTAEEFYDKNSDHINKRHVKYDPHETINQAYNHNYLSLKNHMYQKLKSGWRAAV